MARELRALPQMEMVSTSAEARAAALQYVRVVTGSARPAPEHRAAFEATVLQVAVATQRLLDQVQEPELAPVLAPPERQGRRAAG